MTELAFANTALYTWLLLPLLIFLARVADVSLGTMRLVYLSKGYKRITSTVAFFEVLIWIIAIGQIIQNLSNPICYIAYAAGFAAGNFIGMHLTEKMSLGIVLIRILSRTNTEPMIKTLKENEFGLTTVDANGAYGPIKVIFTIVQRSRAKTAIKIIKDHNPNAFYTIDEVDVTERGFFPKQKRKFNLLKNFRKTK